MNLRASSTKRQFGLGGFDWFLVSPCIRGWNRHFGETVLGPETLLGCLGKSLHCRSVILQRTEDFRIPAVAGLRPGMRIRLSLGVSSGIPLTWPVCTCSGSLKAGSMGAQCIKCDCGVGG